MMQQKISVEEARTFIGTLQEIPNYIEEVLAQAPDIEQLTKRMINANNAFFIGRGLDYTLCMEGALKLKEISYIHAEAYAAGELKHGTIALVSEGFGNCRRYPETCIQQSYFQYPGSKSQRGLCHSFVQRQRNHRSFYL